MFSRRLRPDHRPDGARMKNARTLLLPLLLLAAAAAVERTGSAANDAVFLKPDTNEALYGIWTNAAYWGNNPDYAQKVILYQWGYCETFNKADDAMPSARATFTIVDKWTDSGGNIWYREFRREMGGRAARIVFRLDRIGGDGAVMESVYEFGEFPLEEDMDPRNPRYRVFIRR
jgi:hypothetical protein